MAGRGPAPKVDAHGHRAGARGEWRTVPARRPDGAPPMPKRERGSGPWSARAKRAWAAWWEDGASVLWTSADELTVELALTLLESYWNPGTDADGNRLAGPVSAATTGARLLDGLGLTQRGKRDLRILVVPVAEPEPERELSEIELRRRARDDELGITDRRGG